MPRLLLHSARVRVCSTIAIIRTVLNAVCIAGAVVVLTVCALLGNILVVLAKPHAVVVVSVVCLIAAFAVLVIWLKRCDVVDILDRVEALVIPPRDDASDETVFVTDTKYDATGQHQLPTHAASARCDMARHLLDKATDVMLGPLLSGVIGTPLTLLLVAGVANSVGFHMLAQVTMFFAIMVLSVGVGAFCVLKLCIGRLVDRISNTFSFPTVFPASESSDLILETDVP